MSKVMLIGLNPKEEKRADAFLKSVGVESVRLNTIDAALEKIPLDPPTVVLAENPEKIEALHSLFSVLKTAAPSTPYLVALPKRSVPRALDAMNAGAYDCVVYPFNRFDLLAAAKRAAKGNGRTLFVASVTPQRRRWDAALAVFLIAAIIVSVLQSKRNGPPESVINLGSATLSGLQWEDRNLWVGNWVDSTVTHYRLKKAFFKKQRAFDTDAIYRMQDSQPILVCNTPGALVTVGFDLMMRSHQLGVGLPTLQTQAAPGTNPTGLAWDGHYLWSIDGQTGLLYKHGPDLRVLETIPSILSNPVGLSWDGSSLWILGGAPLTIARLERYRFGNVWRGPYLVTNLLPETVIPSGIGVAFGRLWIVSGGDPRMTSRALTDIIQDKNLKWMPSVRKGVN